MQLLQLANNSTVPYSLFTHNYVDNMASCSLSGRWRYLAQSQRGYLARELSYHVLAKKAVVAKYNGEQFDQRFHQVLQCNPCRITSVSICIKLLFQVLIFVLSTTACNVNMRLFLNLLMYTLIYLLWTPSTILHYAWCVHVMPCMGGALSVQDEGLHSAGILRG